MPSDARPCLSYRALYRDRAAAEVWAANLEDIIAHRETKVVRILKWHAGGGRGDRQLYAS